MISRNRCSWYDASLRPAGRIQTCTRFTSIHVAIALQPRDKATRCVSSFTIQIFWCYYWVLFPLKARLMLCKIRNSSIVRYKTKIDSFSKVQESIALTITKLLNRVRTMFRTYRNSNRGVITSNASTR